MRRPMAVSKNTLLKFIVIALTIVIAVEASSNNESGSMVDSKANNQLVDKVVEKSTVDLVASSKTSEPVEVGKSDVKEAPSETGSAKADSSSISGSKHPDESKSSVRQSDSETDLRSSGEVRKGRSETGSEVAPKSDESSNAAQPAATEKQADKAPDKTAAKTDSKPVPKQAKQPIPTGKNGSKKLPPNLGTVTSTGSGGPSHYMSKHDAYSAYSAIAEKHGAVIESMKKSDKRQLQGGFGGIQKASGIGDMLSPFKGVTDSGLARTLGASMRSIMKSKYSVPAYVASALLGAVALMAFYESPISPLPVPSLPEPPIGRFPPEMPVLPPNLQVPFRTNQQQQQQQQQYNYNQRSQMDQVGSQQVLFPGNNVAQQRQIQSAPAQLAANILSVGKLQSAQRKSGIDYDQSSMRSFFSGPSVSSPQKSQVPTSSKSSSILSFLGLGGSSASSGPEIQQASGLNLNQGQANPSANQMAAQLALAAAANTLEPKGGQQSALSNSHIINKVRSYFTKQASPTGSSSSAGISNVLPYEQYQKMSLIQAVMKDTAFLPGFFSPTRKSGGSPSIVKTTLTTSKPAARMQSANEISQPVMQQFNHQAQQMSISPKQSQANPSGYGLMKAADKLAHAFLETFVASSGVSQRSASSGSSTVQQAADRKSSEDQSPIASAISLLSETMSQSKVNEQQVGGEQAASGKTSAQSAQSSHSQQTQATQQQQSGDNDGQANARSNEATNISSESVQSNNNKQQGGIVMATSNDSGHSRKTRSIGIEYPIENNYENVHLQQQPSRAARINNLVDFVADSYTQNRLLFNLVMNQVGLSQAVPYVEQILASGNNQQL